MLLGTKHLSFYIIGASGFLGGACARYLQQRGYRVFTERVEVTDSSALKNVFLKTRPEVVVNFAGVRAYPTIDWCEDHKVETAAVNVGGAINVMQVALLAGAYPIQITSGCIYQGGPERLFSEEDEPNFFGSFYSRMRVVLQKALQELPVLQARIRMPISMYSHPRNLINKLVSYEKIISIPNSVTLLEDLFPALEKLAAQSRPLGILNLTNEGYVLHQEILEAYKKIIDLGHSYEIISLERLQGPQGMIKAQRSNCVLAVNKAKALGVEMPFLNREKLEEIMKSLKKSL